MKITRRNLGAILATAPVALLPGAAAEPVHASLDEVESKALAMALYHDWKDSPEDRRAHKMTVILMSYWIAKQQLPGASAEEMNQLSTTIEKERYGRN